MPENKTIPANKVYYLKPKSARFDIIEERVSSQKGTAFLIAMKCKNGHGEKGWINREVIERFFDVMED